MDRKKLASLLAILGCLALTSCAKNVPPGNYDAAEVGKVKKVVSGSIISMRPVNIRNKAADNITGSPTDVAANSDVKNHGFEYVIRLNSGAIISLVQTDAVKLTVKQHVLVIYGDNTRIVADEGGDE